MSSNTQPFCTYKSVSSLDTALWRLATKPEIGLPRMAAYSLRHRATTVMQAAKVRKEEIDHQLGHKKDGARTTEDYGQYQPGYLEAAATALEAWIGRVFKMAGLNSHGIPTAARGKRRAAA